MPGPVSDRYGGTPDGAPYVPSWLYKNGPKMCKCGHHEGYHSDDGVCIHGAECKCEGMPEDTMTPIEEM